MTISEDMASSDEENDGANCRVYAARVIWQNLNQSRDQH